mgnify:CR=1 FL=1
MKAVCCPYCGGRTKRGGRTSSGCSRLTTTFADASWALPLSGITGSQRFCSCSTSLVGGNGTVWASSKTACSYLCIEVAGTLGYIMASQQ